MKRGKKSDLIGFYRIDFEAGTKQYQIGLPFTQRHGDFGATSVTARCCATPISKVEGQISNRCSY